MNLRLIICLAFLALFTFAVENKSAAEEALVVPRFAALRTNEVNLRTGPGVKYPIDWVYLKKDLPVEIIQDFENWRMIKDFEGTKGWVHRSGVTGKRFAIVVNDNVNLKKVPQDNAEVIAILRAKVMVKIKSCPKRYAFCKVEVNDQYDGWLRKNDLWGVYPNEDF